MAHRTKAGQQAHDAKVTETVNRFRSLGYRVRADLPGHSKPTPIGGRVPDVTAVKGNRVLIREIETRGTAAKDRDQHRTFGRYAKQEGAHFKVLVVKKRPG